MLPPLLLVVLVSMVKDAFEDYKRSLNDKRENETEVECYDPETKAFAIIEWQKLRVGNIVRVQEDNSVPADLLILRSTGAKGTCYVETKNLDGETNLKIKTTQKDLRHYFEEPAPG